MKPREIRNMIFFFFFLKKKETNNETSPGEKNLERRILRVSWGEVKHLGYLVFTHLYLIHNKSGRKRKKQKIKTKLDGEGQSVGFDVFSASSLVSVGHLSKRKRAIDTVRLLRSFASQLTLRFLGGVGTNLEGVGSGVPMAGLNLVWQKVPKF